MPEGRYLLLVIGVNPIDEIGYRPIVLKKSAAILWAGSAGAKVEILSLYG
uniref:Uncharacterized protein n=1 Tax=Bosea sp. NBC_00436 TaxID=2969620 RepID=A0A9E8A9S1_9HYPH